MIKEKMTLAEIQGNRLECTKILSLHENPIHIDCFSDYEQSKCLKYRAKNGSIYECIVSRHEYEIAWNAQFKGEGNSVFKHAPKASSEFGAIQNMSDFIEQSLEFSGSIYK